MATERGEREADVAVVGAGLAGLTAAVRLVEAGCSVVLLEARDRVGGRVLNLDVGDGKAVELGATWIGPTQERMYELVDELGLATFPTYVHGKSRMLLDGRLSSYAGDLPLMNPLVVADLAQGMARLDRLARRVPTATPWHAARAEERDRKSLADWLERNLRTRRGRRILETYLGAVLVAEASEVSLLHLLFYIRSGVDLDHLLEFEGGAQQDRIVGGSQLLATRLADRLGRAVELACPVRTVEHGTAGVRVISDRLAVRARSLVVAVPPVLAGRIAFEPPLPEARHALERAMRPGTVIKTLAFYEQPFWRDEGLNGFAITPDHPAGFTADYTPPEGSPGVLALFRWGRAADLAREAEQSGRRQLAAAFLGRLFGDRAARPLEMHELDWSAEEWTGGCYAGFLAPGGWTRHGRALRSPVGTIHWAGSETSPIWMGYMEGAVRSGERAADEVIASRGS